MTARKASQSPGVESTWATLVSNLRSAKFIKRRRANSVMKDDVSTSNDLEPFAREAKAIVLLAFRNGPIENLHGGKLCPMCNGAQGYTRISQAEMKQIMKVAVDQMAWLLWLKENDPTKYEREIEFGSERTRNWDPPTPPAFIQKSTAEKYRDWHAWRLG